MLADPPRPDTAQERGGWKGKMRCADHRPVTLGHQPLLGRTALSLFGSDAQGNGLQAQIESQGPGGGKVQRFNPARVETFDAPP